MPRGVTLGQMVIDLRNECGHSIDPAQGQTNRPRMVRLLQRHQRTLWLGNDWRYLKAQRDINLFAGQRYYDFPSDVSVEKVDRMELRWGNTWRAVPVGITGDEYSAMNPDPILARGSFTITNGATAAGTGGFTVTAGTAGAGHQVTQITANGVSLLSAPVLWVGSHALTAQAVVAAINQAALAGYTASNVGAVVTLTANPDLGATPNGSVVSVTVGGDVTVGSVANISGGVNNLITSVTVGGLNILGGNVGWRGTLALTAAAVAASINSISTVPNFTASASSNLVTITEGPQATTSNGATVAVTVAGAVTTGVPVAMAGGAISVRSDPIQKWDVIQDRAGLTEQIEVWPVPASSGVAIMRIYGHAPLLPFAADSDVSTLDGDLIVLMAAAEVLAESKDKTGSALKLQLAKDLLSTLKAAVPARPSINFGTSGHSARGRPGPIRVAYAR